MPQNAGLDALELSAAISRQSAIERFPQIEQFPLITGSDAHTPELVGLAPTLFLLKKMDISEIHMALKGLKEREYLIQ